MTQDHTQSRIDDANKAYWNELCGTLMARGIGIADDSAESLKRFDDWFFSYYPFLSTHVPIREMPGKSVLEAGLGYGSVSQRIAQAGAKFHGLDIAPGPVAMVQHRLALHGLTGDVRQGNILAAPWDGGTFDWILCIGCLHHSGDMAGGIAEVHRMLKRGGQALIMIYNALSYRQWFHMPAVSFRRALDAIPPGAAALYDSERLRAMYDLNVDNEAPPRTEFTARRELKRLCAAFHSCTIRSENISQEGIFRRLPRTIACRLFGSWLGLDLYCHLVK